MNERGRFEDKRSFSDEDSACNAFLNLMGKYHNESLQKYTAAKKKEWGVVWKK